MKSIITMVEKDVDITESAKMNIDAIQQTVNEMSEDEVQTCRISHVSSHTESHWSTPNLFRYDFWHKF